MLAPAASASSANLAAATAEPASDNASACPRATAAPDAAACVAAWSELRDCVGEKHFECGADSIARWSRSTLPSGTAPRAVVRPACTSEVQRIVRIAARHGLEIYPVSTGKNWGYGDACAVTPGQVILDLSRMNRILEVHADLAYATVEPGVTQGQLADYLDERRIPLWTDATGAGPQTSLIGNTLERGFGHTPHGDRFLHVCSLEVVLPDGRLLKTGFGHYRNAQAAAVYKWGVGPYLDGLFTQSNLGIVTAMTFWLLPQPEAFRAFFFSLRDEQDLGGLMEALRPLRLRGTLRTPIHVGNDLRLISMMRSYPWGEMQGQTPLSPNVRARLRTQLGLHAWFGSGALHGNRREVAAAENEVRKALRRVPGIAGVHFFDDRKMRWAAGVLRVLKAIGAGRRLRAQYAKLELCYRLLKGRSPESCVQGGLWRVRRGPGEPLPQSTDPLDHHAGFIWLSPVLPMTASHVGRVNALAETILNRHGFDYQTTFSMVTARALCAVITISFDQRNRAEARRARACHDELLESLLRDGYAPYRAGNLSMSRLDLDSDVFFDVTRMLKRALDPQGLLSPGHYEPACARQQNPGGSTPC